MTSRNLARSLALQVLYEWDFYHSLYGGEELTAIQHQGKSVAVDDIIQKDLESVDTAKLDREFLEKLVHGVKENLGKLNEAIESAAPKWPIAQITLVDRNVLRVGIYELFFSDYHEVPPKVAINYYKAVVAKTGSKPVKESMRFFMVPGMGHGPGTTGDENFNYDALSAVEQWKQTGKAPEELVFDHYKNGMMVGKRLVCQYPKVPTYKGSGNTEDPASFECK